MVAFEDMKSKEALAWLGGFFCGDGSISLASSNKGKGWQGHVCIGQVEEEPLLLAREIVAAHGIETPLPHMLKNGIFQWDATSSKGSEVLRLIYPYLHHPKYRERAKGYLKVFPLGSRHRHMREVRLQGYIEWLELKLAEVQNVEV